jgi:uncharacterized protein (DUF2147 family)
MSENVDPREVFHPFSTVNMMSSAMTLLGLVMLGYGSYSIAKEQISGKDSTPERRRTLNIMWSYAYLGVFVVLLAFAFAYAYD